MNQKQGQKQPTGEEKEKLFQRILHNETASAIQRRLQWEGITTVILPIRVMSK